MPSAYAAPLARPLLTIHMAKRSPTENDAPVGMPSVLDRELADSAEDAFGHLQYAEALKDLIESSSNKPPFSIGLLGPWGTGKSTIKEFYLRGLEADKSGSPGQRRADRIHAITFNAWRFGGEQDLKRSLLREAFRQLGGDEAALRSKLFEQVNKVVHKKRPPPRLGRRSVRADHGFCCPVLPDVPSHAGHLFPVCPSLGRDRRIRVNRHVHRLGHRCRLAQQTRR